MDQLVAYSSERREGMRTQIGSANYSYVFVEDALVGLMTREGYRTRYVVQPEAFKTPLAYAAALQTTPDQVVHIAFRSTENIRPMYGARNICHFAWEFEVMKDGGLATDSILADQVHMLRLMDEVWVGCRFTREVLARYGIADTHLVPAPIVGADLPARLVFAEAVAALADVACVPLAYVGSASRDDNMAAIADLTRPVADLAFVQAKMAGGEGRVFLSVLSPGDKRKNLLAIIDGFQLAAGDSSRDLLLVKLAVGNRGDYLEGGLYDALTPLCLGQMAKHDPRIVFVLDYLTDDQMEALFSLADFYVSASHCEGYNLPLLQAMAHGAVPVSTLNTAMLDYIDADNAIVIAEKRIVSPVERMAADVAGRAYAIGFASRFDVARAMSRARAASRDEIASLAAAARRTVLARYGAAAVAQAVAARLAAPVRAPT